MCTGSQGEPSSIVGRLSAGTNRQFDLKPDDTVVLSSHPIPGNEETHQQDHQSPAAARRKRDLRRDGAHSCIRSRQPGRAEAADQPGQAQSTSCRSTANCAMLKRHAELAEEVGIPEEKYHRRRERTGGGTGRRQDPTGRAHPRRLRLRRRANPSATSITTSCASASNWPATASC